MKFDHLLLKDQKPIKLSTKKSYFTFEVRPFSFLGFNLKNDVYIRPDADNLSDFFFFENSKKNIFIFIFFFFIFFLSFLFFFLYFIFFEEMSFFSNISFIRLTFTPVMLTSDNFFANVNCFFNNLLIDLIHQLELI